MTPREEAARWLVLQDERELTTGEQRAFEEWLREPEHQTAWREAQRSWNIFENADESSPAADDLAGLRRSALEMRPDTTPVAPMRPPSGEPARGSTLRFAMAAGIAVLAVGGALLWLRQSGTPERPDSTVAQVSQPTEYSTAVGEHREVRLADGSRVMLNTGTTLEARFTGGQRLIELRHGQATFFVAKDPARPFIVHAGERSVRAVGTVFDVRVAADQLKVLLAEGKVIVSHDDGDADSDQPLTPGQLLTALRATDQIETVDVTRALRWHEGLVEFNDESLQNAVIEMNRYTQRRVTIRDERTGALRISGIFRTDDMDRFLGDIQELLPIRIVKATEGQTEIAARE